MNSNQDKEFAMFGIINNKLKAGLMIGLLSLSITGNIYLTVKIINLQGDLYEKMLERVDAQVDKKLDVPLKELHDSKKQLDTAVEATIDAAKVTDSAGRQVLKKHAKK